MSAKITLFGVLRLIGKVKIIKDISCCRRR